MLHFWCDVCLTGQGPFAHRVTAVRNQSAVALGGDVGGPPCTTVASASVCQSPHPSLSALPCPCRSTQFEVPSRVFLTLVLFLEPCQVARSLLCELQVSPGPGAHHRPLVDPAVDGGRRLCMPCEAHRLAAHLGDDVMCCPGLGLACPTSPETSATGRRLGMALGVLLFFQNS